MGIDPERQEARVGPSWKSGFDRRRIEVEMAPPPRWHRWWKYGTFVLSAYVFYYMVFHAEYEQIQGEHAFSALRRYKDRKMREFWQLPPPPTSFPQPDQRRQQQEERKPE